MDYRFESIPVDSGVIVIADPDHYLRSEPGKQPYGFKRRPSHCVSVEEGEYEAEWSMPDSWQGAVEGKGALKVTSGKVWVSDPCYVVSDKDWERYLKEQIFPKKKPEGVLILDKHGGDGQFTVLLKLLKKE